jgi:hypothetical protein
MNWPREKPWKKFCGPNIRYTAKGYGIFIIARLIDMQNHRILLTLLVAGIMLQSCRSGFSTAVNRKDSVLLAQKTISFLREVLDKKINDSSWIISDKPFAFEYFDCLTGVYQDTAFFTREELGMIRSKKYPTFTWWHTPFFPAAKMIDGDTIHNIFDDNKKDWRYFRTRYGSGFSTCSVPIFLRDDNYCLFYTDESCGGLCGGGQLVLYRKENGKWVKWKTYCQWIS